MKSNRIVIVLSVLIVFALIFNLCYVQAQTETKFGNVYSDDSWNSSGGVVVASQFTISQSITITWMSALIGDLAPPSFVRLGIFSDSNNLPSACLASTREFPTSSTDAVWCTFPLLNSITLQAGTYWLAEIDSGAGVEKTYFNEGPGSFNSVFAFSDSFMGQLDVGSTFPTSVTSLDGTLAIIASSGQSSNSEIPTPPTYAESAQCWASASDSNPYPTQTSFAVGSPVYIYWTPSNPSTGVVDISVYYPSGTSPGHDTLCSFNDQAPGNAPVSFVPDRPGTWVVTCNGYSTDIFVLPLTVFALPEYALGALLSLIACFAALGVFVNKRFRS